MLQLTNDLYAIVRCAIQFRGEQIAPLGLKSCHIGYLSRICFHPGISQDQLAQMMFINKSNVARQVAVLEEDGFITRTPSTADKRVMELNPTEKALAIMPQLQEVVCQWDKLLTAGISEEDVQTVVRILEAMKANAADWVNKK